MPASHVLLALGQHSLLFCMASYFVAHNAAGGKLFVWALAACKALARTKNSTQLPNKPAV
jgi:hypothetical protein